jgi:hypothetical protein
MPLSMGLFFTLLVLGLNSKVPAAMYQGLVAHGAPPTNATQLADLPPLGYLLAAFLGLNPLKSLLGPTVLGHLAPAQATALTSRAFFPQLVGPSFKHGLVIILSFAAAMSLVAAVASALRGQKFIHEDDESRDQKALLTLGISPSFRGGRAVAGAVPASAGTVAPGQGRPAAKQRPVHGAPARSSTNAFTSRSVPPAATERRRHRLLRGRARHPGGSAHGRRH